MHKFRRVHALVILALSLALLIPLVSCGGGGTVTTPTPTPAATVTATPSTTSTPIAPTATGTPTPTSTSGEALSAIYGVGKNIGDVQFDMVTTSPGQAQSVTTKAYYKNAWVPNIMKFRYDMTTSEGTSIYLVDYGNMTAYIWLEEANMAYKIDMSQAPKNPTENSDQIYPAYLGTQTIDGNLCDGYQYTDGNVTTKLWIWTAKSFPVRMEATTSEGTTIIEYKNIVFGTLSDDLFQLPSTVQIVTP